MKYKDVDEISHELFGEKFYDEYVENKNEEIPVIFFVKDNIFHPNLNKINPLSLIIIEDDGFGTVINNDLHFNNLEIIDGDYYFNIINEKHTNKKITFKYTK